MKQTFTAVAIATILLSSALRRATAIPTQDSITKPVATTSSGGHGAFTAVVSTQSIGLQVSSGVEDQYLYINNKTNTIVDFIVPDPSLLDLSNVGEMVAGDRNII